MITTLDTIRTKVRRITRTPSELMMSNDTLDYYINTAILYDFPQRLRVFNLRQTLTFYTQPNQDVYRTDTADTNSPLYNFKNKYTAIHPPAYIAGVPAFFTQYRDVYFGTWPRITSVSDTQLRGDGTSGPFSGTLSAHPILQGSINFSCKNTTGQTMILRDEPSTVSTEINVLGNLVVPDDTSLSYGTINYVTGAYTFSFPGATDSGAVVYSESVPYQVGKPYSILYFADEFTLRPVPDKVYPVNLEVDIRPTELLTGGQVVGEGNILSQWWQYIAYLTAKKIFDDRMDTESVQSIMPELKSQESLALRTTLEQQCNMRTTTIYTVGKQYWNGFWGPGYPY